MIYADIWDDHHGYEERRRRDFFVDEMENRRQKIDQSVCEYFGTTNKRLSYILSSAYSIDCEDAIKIADDLNLDQLDFLAIDGDLKEFEKEYYKQFE